MSQSFLIGSWFCFLVTGLSTSPEVSQSMIFDFVGATVGSSVFALTIQWGACIVFGTTGVFDIGCDQLVQQEEVRITNLFRILKFVNNLE